MIFGGCLCCTSVWDAVSHLPVATEDDPATTNPFSDSNGRFMGCYGLLWVFMGIYGCLLYGWSWLWPFVFVTMGDHQKITISSIPDIIAWLMCDDLADSDQQTVPWHPQTGHLCKIHSWPGSKHNLW
jgi:hypothetical protein